MTWFRQLAVRVDRDGCRIYVDPAGIPARSESADYILLTHPHYDVFSEADIDLVRTDGTVVIAPASMKKLVRDADHYVRPGDMLTLGELDLLAVPAYTPNNRFHPPDAGWLGYLFTLGGVTYYHAGDTGLIPAMEGIRCDVAFLPCDGHYSMGPEDAARSGEACGASVIVPIHWGEATGNRADVDELDRRFSGTVAILERASEMADEGEHPD